jgi:hypothetical protein
VCYTVLPVGILGASARSASSARIHDVPDVQKEPGAKPITLRLNNHVILVLVGVRSSGALITPQARTAATRTGTLQDPKIYKGWD